MEKSIFGGLGEGWLGLWGLWGDQGEAVFSWGVSLGFFFLFYVFLGFWGKLFFLFFGNYFSMIEELNFPILNCILMNLILIIYIIEIPNNILQPHNNILIPILIPLTRMIILIKINNLHSKFLMIISIIHNKQRRRIKITCFK